MIAPRTFIAALSRRAQAINGKPSAALELGDNVWRELIETVPAAIYTTDAAGRITFYNEAAATLWGCRPELGKSEFCDSWKLYWPDGTPLPHNECPMAMALTQKKPIRGIEAVAERPGMPVRSRPMQRRPRLQGQIRTNPRRKRYDGPNFLKSSRIGRS
jgi:PAS domain-containing protein